MGIKDGKRKKHAFSLMGQYQQIIIFESVYDKISKYKDLEIKTEKCGTLKLPPFL